MRIPTSAYQLRGVRVRARTLREAGFNVVTSSDVAVALRGWQAGVGGEP
jgi:hypothetical protein